MINLLQINLQTMRKLFIVSVAMFGFGFALIPFYQKICEVTGINRLIKPDVVANTQVDLARLVTIELDSNLRSDLPWTFRPLQTSVRVHPGELTTVMYEFQNVQDRTMSAQAIPSYAPHEAAAYFNKVECFCFNQYTLAPGEKKQWPVVFVVDSKLAKSVNTITLSYTFFEVGSKTPAAPAGTVSAVSAKEFGE